MKNLFDNPAIRALRPNQWIKNLVLFAAIIFTGELFTPYYFWMSALGFIIFCALSSSSYLFNDIIDLHFDKLHPIKKKRPLAAGILPLSRAAEISFILGLFGLISSLFLSPGFFLIELSFITLHI